MNNTPFQDLLKSALREDVSHILSKVQALPSRNPIGVRSFTIGENRILQTFESKELEIKNKIKESSNELECQKHTLKTYHDELNEKVEKFKQDNREVQEEIEKVSSERKKIEEEVASSPLSGIDETPPKQQKIRKTNGLFSFLLVAFIAEFVAFLATFKLQQENLSTDAIWLRGIYVFVIYIYTIILYIKYVKTHNKVVKGLLAGCFLLGFVCLLHAIAVTFLNLDVVSTTSAVYDLNNIEPIDTTISTSIISNLISRPGLAEFIIATMLVFLGEIVAIDDNKNTSNNSIETSIQSQEPSIEDIYAVGKQNAIRQIAIYRDKEKKLYETGNKSTTMANDYVNSMSRQLEATTQKMKIASIQLEESKLEEDDLNNKKVSLIAEYDKLLASELACSLNVDVSTIKYEPATKDDIISRSHPIATISEF